MEAWPMADGGRRFRSGDYKASGQDYFRPSDLPPHVDAIAALSFAELDGPLEAILKP